MPPSTNPDITVEKLEEQEATLQDQFNLVSHLTVRRDPITNEVLGGQGVDFVGYRDYADFLEKIAEDGHWGGQLCIFAAR